MNAAIEAEENLKYQRQLAASLVCSLGYEGAVSASQRMSWYGVLICILNDKTAGAARKS